ncbi:MAG: hypothetical protein K8T90_21375 [Planctomycetes bacterium]|nr:hypothetical protein [Planctomycetota bacterium]
MSVLAELYVSSDDAAAGFDANPERFVDRASHKGFTCLELSTLWAIMRGVEWDLATLDEFACRLQRDGGERLIYRLPTAMVADLVTLAPRGVPTLAAAWAATEELGWPPEAAVPVIQALVRLAGRATETGKGVYLWNCV